MELSTVIEIAKLIPVIVKLIAYIVKAIKALLKKREKKPP